MSKKLEDWYKVTWDEDYIYRNVSPPGQTPWNDKFRWSDIVRICFEAKDYFYSDDMYFFIKNRPESYVIPLEAEGANELWSEVIERKLFDPEMAIKAVTSGEGLYCWPSPDLEK